MLEGARASSFFSHRLWHFGGGKKKTKHRKKTAKKSRFSGSRKDPKVQKQAPSPFLGKKYSTCGIWENYSIIKKILRLP